MTFYAIHNSETDSWLAISDGWLPCSYTNVHVTGPVPWITTSELRLFSSRGDAEEFLRRTTIYLEPTSIEQYSIIALEVMACQVVEEEAPEELDEEVEEQEILEEEEPIQNPRFQGEWFAGDVRLFGNVPYSLGSDGRWRAIRADRYHG